MMEPGWLTIEARVADEPSISRVRQPGAGAVAVAWEPRRRGRDTDRRGPEGRHPDCGGDAHPDWARVQELTFTANGLAG